MPRANHLCTTAISRRVLIAGAAAGAVCTSVGAALAQQPASGSAPRAKGPLVWLDMDQKELDDAYDQAVYAPNAAQLHKRREANSEGVRERLGAPRRVAYGASPIEMLDIYRDQAPERADHTSSFMAAPGAPGSPRTSPIPAEVFVNAGAHFVVPDFINVIEAGGSLMPMAEQVRRAVAWVQATRRASAAIPTASTWQGARRVRISPA